MGELCRGFKAEAEGLAVAVRERLGVDQTDRFDCLDLAADLNVPVLSLTAMADWGASPASGDYLSRVGTEFLALTVCAGTARLIVYNPITLQAERPIRWRTSSPTFSLNTLRPRRWTRTGVDAGTMPAELKRTGLRVAFSSLVKALC